MRRIQPQNTSHIGTFNFTAHLYFPGVIHVSLQLKILNSPIRNVSRVYCTRRTSRKNGCSSVFAVFSLPAMKLISWMNPRWKFYIYSWVNQRGMNCVQIEQVRRRLFWNRFIIFSHSAYNTTDGFHVNRLHRTEIRVWPRHWMTVPDLLISFAR